jgi:hypothetical protein
MNHIEFAELETASLAAGSEFEAWCEKAEKILGHDLDGDEVNDGYSLDGAFDWYDGGDTPKEYAQRVLIACGRCIRCGERELHKEHMRRDICSECREELR